MYDVLNWKSGSLETSLGWAFKAEPVATYAYTKDQAIRDFLLKHTEGIVSYQIVSYLPSLERPWVRTSWRLELDLIDSPKVRLKQGYWGFDVELPDYVGAHILPPPPETSTTTEPPQSIWERLNADG